MTVNTISLSGSNVDDFTITVSSGSCSLTESFVLASDGSCQFIIGFAPTGGGTRTATLTATGSYGEVDVPLTGEGDVGAIWSPTTVDFGGHPIGSSMTKVFELTNATNASTVAVSGITLTASDGTPTSAFSVAADSCSNTDGSAVSIAGGGSCSIDISYSPMSPADSAVLTAHDNYGTQTAHLAGSAVDPLTMSPSGTITLRDGVGQNPRVQPVTIRNPGTVGVSFTTTLTPLGTIPGQLFVPTTPGPQVTPCYPGSHFYLPPGYSCTIYLVFIATSLGHAQAMLQTVDQYGFDNALLIFLSGEASPPVVSAVDPLSGPASGGTRVTISGSNFTGATAVDFGGTPSPSFTVDSDTQITATAPSGTGLATVTVTTPFATSASNIDCATYNPPGPCYAFFSAIKPHSWPLKYTGQPVIVNPQVTVMLVGSWWCTLPGLCNGTQGNSSDQPEALRLLDDVRSEMSTVYDPSTSYAQGLAGFGQKVGCLFWTSIGCSTSYVGNFSLAQDSQNPYSVAVIPDPQDPSGDKVTQRGNDEFLSALADYHIQSLLNTTVVLVYDPTTCNVSGQSHNVPLDPQTVSPAEVILDTCAMSNGANQSVFDPSTDDMLSFQMSHELDEVVLSSNFAWDVPAGAPYDSTYQPRTDLQIADVCNSRDPNGDLGYNEAPALLDQFKMAFRYDNLARDAFGHVVAAYVNADGKSLDGSVAYGPCTVGTTAFPPFNSDLRTRSLIGTGRASANLVSRFASSGGGGLLTLVTHALPNAQQGLAYSQAIVASGGTAPLIWRILDGQLPPGLSLDAANGGLKGVPSQAGAWTFTAQVMDSTKGGTSGGSPTSSAQTATETFQLLVDPPAGSPPVITSISPNHAFASGGTVVQVSGSGFRTGRDNTTFRFGSTPATQVDCPSSAHCTVTVPGGVAGSVPLRAEIAGGSSSAGVSFDYGAPGALTLTIGELPGAVQGQPFSSNLMAQMLGPNSSYGWSLTAGSLPPGLTLGPDGVIQGTPLRVGSYHFTVRVTDLTRSGIAASSPATIDVTAPDLLGGMSSMVGQLRAMLSSTGSRPCQDSIRSAVSKLEDSLRAKYWEDNAHLRSPEGQKVFEIDREVVRDLLGPVCQSSGEGPILHAIATQLLRFDLGLAQVAVDDTTPTRPGSKLPPELIASERDLELATTKLVMEPEKAINLMVDAWHKAKEAASKPHRADRVVAWIGVRVDGR